jgi:hypothetical protein
LIKTGQQPELNSAGWLHPVLETGFVTFKLRSSAEFAKIAMADQNAGGSPTTKHDAISVSTTAFAKIRLSMGSEFWCE